jgi:hypothetical protein
MIAKATQLARRLWIYTAKAQFARLLQVSERKWEIPCRFLRIGLERHAEKQFDSKLGILRMV